MARGKKGKKQRDDDWPSDQDESKFELKPADADAEVVDEAITASTAGKRGKKNKKSQSVESLPEIATADIPSAADEAEPVVIPEPAKKSKKKNKVKQPVSAFDVLASAENDASEDDSDLMPKSKSKAVNAFDSLVEESPVAATSSEPEEDAKPKKKKSSKKKSGEDAVEDPAVEAQLEDLSLSGSKKRKKKRNKDKSLESLEQQDGEKQEEDTRAFADADEAPVKQSDGTFVSKTEHLTATGILLSNEGNKDVQIDKFSVAAYGQQLVNDTSLNLLYGRKYGLIAANGQGKSTLLKCLAHREVPIQSNVSLYLLEREYDPSDMTAVEAVVEIVKTERDKLEEEMEELLSTVEGAESARMDFINERLRELDLSFAEQKARNVLHGLGFTEEMQDMKTSEFSGGWRMRVALARALFVKPTILLLDDATNHLDLSAVVWLEDYLKSYPHTILMVSHSADFLNSICSDIMYLHNRKLDYFSGNYDNFLKVKAELDEAMLKRFKAEEKKMKKIKENLGRSGTQAKQAKAQQKLVMKQREKDGNVIDLADIMDIEGPKEVKIHFLECGGGLPSPFLKFNDVSFHYPGRPLLYHDLNFGLDLKSRVALVGPNGAGKSTLMKLMTGDLEPTSGTVERHHHLKIARFHQHLTEQLDLKLSAVEWMCNTFGNVKPQAMRGIIGRFGLTGKSQVVPMEQLSDGQLRRVVFAWLSQRNCHLLMLDEPTNFLDMETIDALADGINEFDGGVVLVSHDFRLINQVAEEIWVVEDGTVEEWEGDIQDYKDYLKRKVVT